MAETIADFLLHGEDRLGKWDRNGIAAAVVVCMGKAGLTKAECAKGVLCTELVAAEMAADSMRDAYLKTKEHLAALVSEYRPMMTAEDTPAWDAARAFLDRSAKQ